MGTEGVNTTAEAEALATSLAEGIRAGQRRALARAITLVESRRDDHRAAALSLLNMLMPDTGRAVRIGLSGTPGVGKSTFIESFGTWLTGQGHKVAVLTVDPTSARSGGSILGDKTRMEHLARDGNAFIRSSPSGGTLGGVARRTREAMLLLEAAGFDVVLVETVGVGQSETAVADMVDMFVLLQAPGGGDELQGIKRGIMELADLLIVNKADGDLEAAANRAVAEYRAALALMRPKYPFWRPQVLKTSALTGKGIERVWRAVEKYRALLEEHGELKRLRAAQAKRWMWSELQEALTERLKANRAVAEALPALEHDVAEGRLLPSAGARILLNRFLDESGQDPAN